MIVIELHKAESILSKYGLLIIIVFAAFLSFWKLGHHPLEQWDESRRGLNAIGMIENKDIINYYVGEQQDTSNAKPPLAIWLIALNFVLFGASEFTLRLHSALATIIIFIFIYRLCRLYQNHIFSFLICLILFGVKGLIGYHVGRTGDTDALLIMFMLGGTYYFLKYNDFGNKNAIFLAVIFFGLAFYTKGIASFFYFPGIIIYLIVTKSFPRIFQDLKFWFALVLLGVFISSWIVLLIVFGDNYNIHNSVARGNLETMFLNDILIRFFEKGYYMKYDPWYFFDVIDAGFNIWNYVFFLVFIMGIYIFYKKRKKLLSYITKPSNQLVFLSVAISFSIIIILTISRNKCRWYLAPAYPFIAIITVKGMLYITKRINYSRYVWILLLLFTITRHFLYLNAPKENINTLFNSKKKEIAIIDKVIIYGSISQNAFLYLKWRNRNVKIIKTEAKLKEYLEKGDVVFCNKENIKHIKIHNYLQSEYCYENYCFLNL